VQKRGKDFWNEFELYAADLLVGIVVDIALVGLLAPYVRFGRASASTGPLARFNRACSSLPGRFFFFFFFFLQFQVYFSENLIK
jgi:Protein RETICULATA-related